jgi:serine/threonine-protein kinase
MEYVDGKTVRELLNDGHRLLPERILEIISGVLRALEYSHQAGIVHRDIKPGNVMVTRNGDVKVMDFGIARAMSDAQATMTQTAQVIGTAQYLSPEQARGERVDTRSDLYSTGCLMYELLVGRPPFTGDSPVAIAYQHVRENPIPPSRLDPDLPPWADAIVLKAMAKSANDRYQTAAEMNADIQRAASGMQVAAAFQPPPTRADYYDYQQRTQRMGPQTMMGAGVAPTTVSQYPQGGYPPGYQPGYNEGGYDNTGDGEQGGGGRRWLPWTIAGVVLVAAIVAAVLLLHGGGGSGAFVPTNLVGESQSMAVSQVKAAGLNPSVQKQTNATVTAGNVISTNPSSGSSIAKGGTVTLYVSEGAAPIQLPNVQNEQYNTAAQQLKALGFTNVNPVPDNQSTLPAGEVDHMSPAAGQKYPADQQITLYYSGGGIQVPNLTGVPLSTALQELKSYGFTSQPNTDEGNGPVSQNIPVGTVWNQVPAAGKMVPPNTVITLFVQQTAATPSTSPSVSVTPTGTPSSTPSTPPATPTATATSTPPGP